MVYTGKRCQQAKSYTDPSLGTATKIRFAAHLMQVLYGSTRGSKNCPAITLLQNGKLLQTLLITTESTSIEHSMNIFKRYREMRKSSHAYQLHMESSSAAAHISTGEKPEIGALSSPGDKHATLHERADDVTVTPFGKTA